MQINSDSLRIFLYRITPLFCREIQDESISMGKRFQRYFANNSQYIMIFCIFLPRWGMFLVLGGHLVTIGDGYG